ncbi:MAG TPA: efflux transporter outer membrane subunit [Steroidobacteraceae bacterium]|nr:efflux transporter outer membrane subunit [Steroidobacteraceae bacterium]
MIGRARPGTLLTGLLLCASGGCTVGPDFRPPTTPAAERYTEADLSATTASADIPGGAQQHLLPGRDIPADWWELFRSPQINALVITAIRDNPSLEAAGDALRAARESASGQRADLFPSAAAKLSYARVEQPQSYENGARTSELSYTDYGAHLDLSYAVDFWGAIRRRAEEAQAHFDNERFQLEAEYLAITAGVVTAAIQTASLEQQVDAQLMLIGFESRQLETVRGQFEAGSATAADVATQESEVAQAQMTLQSLQTRRDSARHQLAAYLGHAPANAEIPRIDLDSLSLPVDLPVSLPASLVAQRPDIRAAEALLHEQTAALGVAIAQRLPNISIAATVGSDAATPGEMFTATNNLWSLATQVVQPVFDAGRLKHAQRAQDARMKAAAALWRSQVVVAYQNVADVLTTLQNDAVGLRYALTAQQAADRNLKLASAQYELGGVSYLSVLTAQQIYQSTSIALIQAKAARFTDTVLLYQALGGGWWNRPSVTNGQPD